MKITYFHRKPFHFHQSIEKLFAEIRTKMPGDVEAEVKVAPFYSLGLIPRIKNILWARQQQGEVNHITGDIHYIALGLKKSITLLTIHDIGFIHHPNPIIRLILKIFWLIIPIKRSALVTVISQATKDHILKHVRCSPDKIKVVPNAISPEWQKKEKIFNDKEPILLQIGTKANKNLERVVEAIRDVKCKLKIVGKLSAQQEALLKKFRINYENYFNISEIELMHHYETSDIVVFCSTLEGFGLPIIEAQSVGRVVVTSNLSAMPEVAGEGACFVDPYDVISIKEGILHVMNDSNYRVMLINKGFENIKRFDPVVTAQQYYQLYRQIIENA